MRLSCETKLSNCVENSNMQNTAEDRNEPSAVFSVIGLQKNDYKYRILLDWASRLSPWEGRLRQMLPLRQSPRSNLQQYWGYTSSFYRQARQGQVLPPSLRKKRRGCPARKNSIFTATLLLSDKQKSPQAGQCHKVKEGLSFRGCAAAVGLRSAKGIPDCHVASLLAMTRQTK